MQENQWLDASTKKSALKKLNAIVRNVDFDDWIFNNTLMDSIYNLVINLIDN